MKISKTHHVTKHGKIKKNPETFNLPIQTATIVPSTKNKHEKISSSEFESRVKITKEYLVSLFGGYTSVSSEGSFVTAEGRIVPEKSAVVVAYAERDKFKKHKKKWMDWCRDKAEEWEQESIGVIIENDMKYVNWSKK